jgi:hypothetical protein
MGTADPGSTIVRRSVETEGSVMRVFAFITFPSACVTLITAQPVDLAGSWKGTWTKDGDALPVTMTFSRTGDTYSGV